MVALWTTEAETASIPKHRHRMFFDADGNGWTDEVAGHRHRVRWCAVMSDLEHEHDQTIERAPLEDP